MQYFLKFFTISALGFFIITGAKAQMSANPPEISDKIRSMGTKFNRDVIVNTRKLYGPLMKTMPKDGIDVDKDQSYGTHARHKLDVFKPKKLSSPVPIVVYLHGGGFNRGDKKGSFNIGTFFARNGIIGITANYRLAPKANWPAGPEDISGVIKWIKSNATKIGGNPNKIFLMGHSAGAGHVAGYAFFEENQLKDDGVSGVIFSSLPTFNLATKVSPKGVLYHPGEKAYFGTNPKKYERMSPSNHVAGRKIPLYIAYAEFDMPMVQNQNLQLINAIYKRDKKLPTVKQVQGHNHISIMMHINTKDELFGLDLLEFIKTN